MNRSRFISGVLLCIIGSVCFSTKAIFVKLAYSISEIDSAALLTLRMAFSLPFFVSIAIHSHFRDGIKYTRNELASVFLIGCLGYYVSSWLDFEGLKYIPASLERLVLYLYPVFVLFFSSWLYKVKITRLQYLSAVISYAGIGLVFYDQPFSANQEAMLTGSLLVFLCAVTFALYLTLSQRMILKGGSVRFNSYAMIFASCAVFIHHLVTNGFSFPELSLELIALAFGMAILSTVLPSYLIAEGINRIGSGNATLVGTIGPVSTLLQASLFLHEEITFLQLSGTILIMFGVVLVAQKPKSYEA